MKFEIVNSRELFLTLKKHEAMELVDALNDLTKNENADAHHHVSSYDFISNIIDSEIIVSIEKESNECN